MVFFRKRTIMALDKLVGIFADTEKTKGRRETRADSHASNKMDMEAYA